MFLNKTRIASGKASATIKIVIGVLLLFFSVVGIIGLCMDEKSSKSPDAGAITVGIVIMLLGFLLIFFGVLKNVNISDAKRLSNIFEGDDDGIVDVEKTAKLMGMTKNQFIVKFNKYICNGYIRNASLSNENGLCILLTREGEASPELEYLKCPDCGATTPVRKGYSGKCQFCGSPLNKD